MEYIKLCEVISSAKTERCGASDYPVLSITKSDGVVLQSDKFKKRIASTDTEQYKLVKRGQLVQGIHIDEANFGIQSIVDIGIVSPAYKIWNVDFQKIVPKYLETVLRSPRSVRYYSSKFNGSVKRRERITDSDFLAMEIPFPSKEQQQYAVDVLEKACSMTTLYQQQLQKLDELVKARFVEMFGELDKNPYGWKLLSLGALIASCEAGWSGTGTQRKKQDGEVAVLKVSAVTKGYFIPSECKVLDNQSNIKKYIYPQKGDLLFSRANTREMVGATVVITEDFPEHILPDKLWKISYVEAANVWYMKYALSSKPIRSIFSSISTGTSGSMYNVSMEKFKSIEIPLPPLNLQNQFAAFVEQADKTKVAIKKALDETQLLFDSLMQKYFG